MYIAGLSIEFSIVHCRETNLGQQEVWNVKENTLEPLDQNGKPGVPYTFGINILIKYIIVHSHDI